MKRKCSIILAALLLLVLVPFGPTQSAAAAIDYSNVRVLLSIGDNVKSFSFTVKGSYFVQETGQTFKNGTLTAKIQGNKVALSHSTAGELYTGSSVNVMREKIDPSAGYLTGKVGSATRNYLGHFMFKYNSANAGQLRIVNTVPLAHYLYGVVRGEMGDGFPLEALKAQTVAAKCYVLANISPTTDYDIGDTAADQVYKGYIASETAVIRAVNETYDMGLYLGSNILCAYYAASNGGYTILPSDRWSGTNRYVWDKAYKRVEDPYDVANPLTPQETVAIPMDGDNNRKMTAKMSDYLRARAKMALQEDRQISSSDEVTFIEAVQSLTEIGSLSDTANNALIEMTVIINDSESMEIKFPFNTKELRWNSVMTHALSNSMRIMVFLQDKTSFYIRQGCYGHGVGLSQRGAQQMANEGIKYDKILKFYYPGATLKQMGVTPAQDPVNSKAGSQSSSITAYGQVTSSTLNFRDAPSTTGSKVLLSLKKGDQIGIYGLVDKTWYYCNYNGQNGYVSADHIKLIETPVDPVVPDTATTDPTDPGDNENPTTVASGTKATVTVASTYLRSNPTTARGSVLATLKQGVEVTIANQTGTYYGVTLSANDGSTLQGYVLKTAVKVGGTSTSTSGSTTASTGKTNTSGVNLRKGAGTNYSSLKKLSNGTALEILGESGDWYKVKAGSTEGYVIKKYVTLTSTSSSSSTVTPPATSTGVKAWRGVIKGDWVWLRSSASLSSDANKITQLAVGTEIIVYSQSGDFYKLSAGEYTGYASKSYVTVLEEITLSSDTKSAVTTATVNLRDKASATGSKVLTTLAKGTAIVILGESGDYYQATANGTTGYLIKKYVKVQ